MHLSTISAGISWFGLSFKWLVNSITNVSIVLYFLFFPLVIYTQNCGIKGKIIDNSNGDILISATIKVNNYGTISNDQGEYQLNLGVGKYIVEFSYLGFEPEKINVTINTGEFLELNIALNPQINILETAVISDSRYQKPISTATISMEVIKSNLVDHLNTTSVTGVLDKVPGMIMVGDQANIRGGAGYSYGAGSRVLLMINEVPALQADAGSSNWSDVPVENIEQIEVIKGAASAIYGSSALNGLIHVRTKYARSEPITKFSIYYNSVLSPKNRSQEWWTSPPFGTGLSMSHAQKYGKLDLVLGAFVQKDKSYNQSTGSAYGRLNGSLQYRFSDRFTAGIHFNGNKRKSDGFFYFKDGVNAIYRPDSSTISHSNSFRFHIDPFVNFFDKFNNKHTLRSRIYTVDNIVSGGQSNSSTMYYNEYQFQRTFDHSGWFVSAGLVDLYNVSNSDLFSRLPFKSDNKAVYAQVEKKIRDKTTLSAGWRYESYILHRPEIFKGDTAIGGVKKDHHSLFRFGLNSKLADKTFLRASWGQGFRFPTLAEQFIATTFGSTFISPNPTLKSETGWTGEIGLKRGFSKTGFNAYADIALFWSRYRDMMEFVFTGFVKGFQSQNIGDTDIKGIELSVGGNTSIRNHKFSILGGYTYINPKFQHFTEEENRRSSADYNILKYRSKHLLKLDVEDQVGKWIIGSGFLYSSKMEAIDAIFELVIKGLKDFRSTHNGYFLQDIRIAREVDHFTFNIIGKNIWNAEYSSRPALLEAPRNITLKIDYKF
ncbi:MAG: TonB-dependent receptor [Saprospiraceae bacterium]